MSETFDKFIYKNLIAIIGALLVLGGLAYAVKNQGDLIGKQDAKIVDLFKYRTEIKVEQAQTTVKLDMIVEDLKEIKGDLKYIKSNINGKYDARDNTKVASINK